MPSGLFALALFGAAIIDFDLPDCSGRIRSLSEWDDKPIVVVAFLSADCPVAQEYAQRVQEIVARVGTGKLAVVGIFADPNDSGTKIDRMRERLGRLTTSARRRAC